MKVVEIVKFKSKVLAGWASPETSVWVTGDHSLAVSSHGYFVMCMYPWCVSMSKKPSLIIPPDWIRVSLNGII